MPAARHDLDPRTGRETRGGAGVVVRRDAPVVGAREHRDRRGLLGEPGQVSDRSKLARYSFNALALIAGSAYIAHT
ncbi:hypothetical protein [Lentzea waywayandensis]|uniref:hypothetical protein n=1 Tax=Lentzea waywayandensis TaxID=84724 RepID=UPI000B87B039|nr:hypothetical protein [Lentzea waywayandensis]